MDKLKVDEWSALEQVLPFVAEWEAMVGKERLTPAHTYDWLRVMWEIYRSSVDSLMFLTVRSDDCLVGMAPFVKKTEWRKGLKIALLKPLNVFSLHGTQFVLDGNKPAVMEAIVRHLAFQLRDCWGLWFMTYQENEEQAQMFERLLTRYRYFFSKRATERSPYLRICGTWEDKMKTLQPRFRTALRSRQKRLEERGKLELRFFNAPENWRRGLEAISEIEEGSWKASAMSAITRDARQWAFYEKYAPLAAANHTLRIAVLYVAGEPVAYDYALFKNGVYYLLKTSYKKNWEDAYPGFVLRKLLMERLYAEKAVEMDFLGKDEQWKMKWTDSVRPHVEYTVFNRTLQGRYLLACNRIASLVKKGS